MNQADYYVFYRQVENKIRHANGAWFTVGWDGMVTVCEAKVAVGTLEKRFNKDKGRLEFRAL